MTFEIKKVRNGYVIFPGSRRDYDPSGITDPWVFESLHGALEFLRDKFTEKSDDEKKEIGK